MVKVGCHSLKGHLVWVCSHVWRVCWVKFGGHVERAPSGRVCVHIKRAYQVWVCSYIKRDCLIRVGGHVERAHLVQVSCHIKRAHLGRVGGHV